MSEFIMTIEKIWPYLNSYLFIAIAGSLIYFFGKTISTFMKDELPKDEIYITGFLGMLKPLLFIILLSSIIEKINYHSSFMIVTFLLLVQVITLDFVNRLKDLVVLGKYYGLYNVLKQGHKEIVKDDKRLKSLIDYLTKFDRDIEQSIKKALYIANSKLVYIFYLVFSTIIFIILIKYGNLTLSIIGGILYFISLIIYNISISIINSIYPKSTVRYGGKKFVGFIVKETNRYIKLRLVNKPKFVYLYHDKIDYIESNIFKKDAQKKYSKYYEKGASK